MKYALAAALLAAVSAKHHHHKKDNEFASVDSMEKLEAMSENKLVSTLKTTLKSAHKSEKAGAKKDAVAKTAAIKNI